MFGFGIGQGFLTRAVAPGTARRALVCLVSKQKPEGGSHLEGTQEGWSGVCPRGKQGRASSPHRTHDPAVQWAPRG